MWQRVQTLYLALSTVLIALMFFCEKAEGITYLKYIPYLVLLVLITLLNVLALTTYRFRIFQMRTAVLSALLTLALQAWLAVECFTVGSELVYHVTMIFPLVAVVFDLLAARGIFADELMVRSASRLRSAKRRK